MLKTKESKWPNRKQWAQFFKILSKKEKIAFLVFFVLFLSSFTFICFNFYYNNTKTVSTMGGTYTEGIIGQPRFINPIYANSDVDRDLTQLIFSGLMKYDENLNVVPNLAENFEIEDEGKIYVFHLKENLEWEDGEPITVDDIIFTIHTIQNPEFKSPIQANWVGVETEKVNDSTIRFILKKPYAAFLENSVIGILPQHIWQNVSAEEFAFEPHNLEPIGSGPFKIKKVKQKVNQIVSITLNQNPFYHGKKPNISEIKFLFFEDEDKLIRAAQKENIQALSLSSAVTIGEKWENHIMSLPRYFAVFFNQEKLKVLGDKNIRLALNYATDKKEIHQKIVDSPILPEMYGFDLPETIYEFDLEKAKEILDENGYQDTNGDGIREKTISKKPAFEFKSQLAKGSEGKEVTELQKCLGGTTSGYFGSETEQLVKDFQEKNNLDTVGIVGKGTRAVLNEFCFGEPDEIIELKITLVTVDQLQMTRVSEILKEQWKKIGIELEVQQYSLLQLEKNFIKPRDYDALLFGEVLGAIPDPFPFWHSSQKKDPGLNLAIYDNKKADTYLEDNRKASDLETRTEKLNSFQNVLIEDIPCVFLYSPDFIYATSKDLKGVDVKKITNPSKRFIGIEDWFINTKRIWN